MIYIHESKMDYVAKYGLILEANNIPYEMVNCQQNDFWEKMQNASLYIYYPSMGSAEILRQKNLLSILDKVMNIPCFPNWETAWHYDDKLAMTYLMQSKGYPLAESWIFWDKNLAHEWAAQAKYPLVFKLKNGASSINVIKVTDYKHAAKLINLMFGRGIINNRVPGSNLYSIYMRDWKKYLKAHASHLLMKYGYIQRSYKNTDREHGYVLFQEFIPNNDYDTRIHVIGDSAFALRRKNRPNDFRASGAGKIDFTPEKINPEMVKMSLQMNKEMGFNAMTFDFMLDDEGKPILNEIGCQYADWAPYLFPGFWDEEMNWHEGHFWPQYTQLKYLLKREDLIQPDIPYTAPPGYTFKSF